MVKEEAAGKGCPLSGTDQWARPQRVMYCQVAARFAFLWILKIAVLTPSLSDPCWAYIFINLVPLVKDCALNKFPKKTHLVSVIWQWAWRFGFLDVSLY